MAKDVVILTTYTGTLDGTQVEFIDKTCKELFDLFESGKTIYVGSDDGVTKETTNYDGTKTNTYLSYSNLMISATRYWDCHESDICRYVFSFGTIANGSGRPKYTYYSTDSADPDNSKPGR